MSYDINYDGAAFTEYIHIIYILGVFFMNKGIVTRFTALTFLIVLIAWGICAVFGLFGFTLENAAWLWASIVLYGLSPDIASYYVLKKNNRVKGFKEWLKNIFAVKSPLCFYLLVVTLIIAQYVPKVIISGVDEMMPFYMFFALLPVALIGGGLEEAGWSYVLRPELDKKFGFAVSSSIVAVIWTVWHIPILLLEGRLESLSWLGLFAIGLLGESFALGAIVRITKNIFLCILFHTLGNVV